MKKIVALLVPLIAVSLTGCQGVNGALDGLNNGLTDTNDVLGAVANPDAYPSNNAVSSPAFVPSVSQSSMESANNVIMQSVNTEGNSQLASQVQQAMPVIDVVLSSLMRQGNPCGAEMYKAAGENAFGGWYCGSSTTNWPENAPKDQPLVVQSVGKWKSNSANEFGMTLSLCSTISQTCVTNVVDLINMGTGWQIKSVSMW